MVASLLKQRKDDMARYSTGAFVNIDQALGAGSDSSDDVSEKEGGSSGPGHKDRPIKPVEPMEAATKCVISEDSNLTGPPDEDDGEGRTSYKSCMRYDLYIFRGPIYIWEPGRWAEVCWHSAVSR